MPIVSVVMSVYNFDRIPMRGIETILSQSMEDFEFILVDDGSEEDTRRILEDYARKDNRIRLIVNEKRLRLASSLNKAIRLAQGKYIARADVNISYHRERLKTQLDFMEEHPDIDILGSNFNWGVDGEDGVKEVILPGIHKEIVRHLSIGCCICHPSVMFRKNKLLPFGPYREGFGRAEDYDLWMRARGKMKFHNLQEFLLTKWHRPNPWHELSRFEYLLGRFRSRIAGLSTSPCIWRDLVYFPMIFHSLFTDRWIHRLVKSLR